MPGSSRIQIEKLRWNRNISEDEEKVGEGAGEEISNTRDASGRIGVQSHAETSSSKEAPPSMTRAPSALHSAASSQLTSSSSTPHEQGECSKRAAFSQLSVSQLEDLSRLYSQITEVLSIIGASRHTNPSKLQEINTAINRLLIVIDAPKSSADTVAEVIESILATSWMQEYITAMSPTIEASSDGEGSEPDSFALSNKEKDTAMATPNKMPTAKAYQGGSFPKTVEHELGYDPESERAIKGKEKASSSSSNSGEGDLCPICLEPITSLSKVLPCGHQFDYECIRLWLEQISQEAGASITCPFCRQSIETMLFDFQNVASMKKCT